MIDSLFFLILQQIMAKILFASVPLSGHVHPALPIAGKLVEKGHKVVWYSGSFYKDIIERSGATFIPFSRARDYHDDVLKKIFPDMPSGSLKRHAAYYIGHVFYDNMCGQYEDIKEILEYFPVDVLFTDEWFTGAIPFAERREIPWICYCNSPLMYFDDYVPFPGSGKMPASGIWGRNRNRTINWLVSKVVFRKLQKYINNIRADLGMDKMKHPFIINNIFLADYFIKFNTPAFEFPWRNLPEQIRFAGPVLPPLVNNLNFKWLEMLPSERPVIFITQGSVNMDNFNKLIIPSLKALSDSGMLIFVASGRDFNGDLCDEFIKPDVIIEKYIPYSLILPYTSVMITNGGFGGVITALYNGVPLVVAGDSEDKPEIAVRVNYTRTGIDLGTGEPTPRKIRQAVRRVLLHPDYKANAMRISKDFKKYNAVNYAIKLIESIL